MFYSLEDSSSSVNILFILFIKECVSQSESILSLYLAVYILIVPLLCKIPTSWSSIKTLSKNQLLILADQLSDLTISHLQLASQTPATSFCPQNTWNWLSIFRPFIQAVPSATNALPPEFWCGPQLLKVISSGHSSLRLSWCSHSLPRHSCVFCSAHLILSHMCFSLVSPAGMQAPLVW